MINLFGAGGGGGAVCTGAALFEAASEIDGGGSEAELLSALIWLEFESLFESMAGPWSASESSDLRGFLLFLPMLLLARSVGTVLEACVAGGTATAAAGAFPTCRLLTTSLTPATDAACRLAASRCASLSTVPPSVTTPLFACTVSCFAESPESWLNLP